MPDQTQPRRVIPAGLTRCSKCGEYRGDRAIVPSYRYDLLDIVSVSCLCDGIPCRYCGERGIHRPTTDYFVESTGRAVHVPHFGAMIPCEDCWQRAKPTAVIAEGSEFETRHVTSLDGKREVTCSRPVA